MMWGREPVMILALIQALLALALTFGVHLTNEQVGSVMAVAAAVLGFIARTQVTAPANLPGAGLRR